MTLGEHRWQVPAQAGQMRSVRDEVGRLAGPCLLDAERMGDVALAVCEAASNSVRHGFPDGRAGTVSVSVWAAVGALTVSIADDGVGFGGLSADPGSGLGLGIMRRLADELDAGPAVGGGARVLMVFRPRAAPALSAA